MAEPAAIPDTTAIPDKLYFRIGEVSALVGVQPYVLRFWETEFSALQPKKSGTGHRLFRRKDVELLLKIKHLLYEKRFTIEGARQHLQQDKPAARRKAVPQKQQALFGGDGDGLAQIRAELAEILTLLK
ncbi:MAG: MerR family transcriptional regulator [Bryobacterales bacterium]|nr:MerR family transcriptional regulator [Bryobacterales bacterium]